MARTSRTTVENTAEDAQKAGLLTRPTPATTSPTRPEPGETGSSPRDAPSPKQGRSENLPTPYTSLKGSGRGCPLLRASSDHCFIVGALRARRAPGRSPPPFLASCRMPRPEGRGFMTRALGSAVPLGYLCQNVQDRLIPSYRAYPRRSNHSRQMEIRVIRSVWFLDENWIIHHGEQ